MPGESFKKLTILAVGLMSLMVTACAELGPEAYDPATAPTPVFAEASSSRGMFDAPDAMPANKVFKDGETTGSYAGQDYVCGNPDCTVAIKGYSTPPPHAEDTPGAGRH